MYPDIIEDGKNKISVLKNISIQVDRTLIYRIVSNRNISRVKRA